MMRMLLFGGAGLAAVLAAGLYFGLAPGPVSQEEDSYDYDSGASRVDAADEADYRDTEEKVEERAEDLKGEKGTAREMVVIGLDLSKSNPLVISDSYAAKAAGWVRRFLRRLEPASEIRLRTFGVYDQSANVLTLDREIYSEYRPEDAEREMGTIIAGIPKLVANGTLEAQDETNILPFLFDVAEVLDCKAVSTRIILITDGLEDSEFADLSDPEADLPKRRDIFEDCTELQIVGLGQGLASPKETERLRKEWESWANYAGFKSFRGLSSW